MNSVEPCGRAQLSRRVDGCPPALERGSRIARGWLFAVAALIGLAGVFAPSAAEASVRGRRAVPDLRNPRTTPRTSRQTMIRIPVTLHLATNSGEAIASRRSVERWVIAANRALAPYGIEVEVVDVLRMPAGYRAITRRQHRRQLARFASNDGTVHLFVTEALDLEYRPFTRRRVRGLHWRYWGLRRDLKRREYLVVTRDAPETTLAHEVGHLLGLRHSLSESNIMCSCREAPSRFTNEQGRSMREGALSLQNRQSRASTAADRRR